MALRVRVELVSARGFDRLDDFEIKRISPVGTQPQDDDLCTYEVREIRADRSLGPLVMKILHEYGLGRHLLVAQVLDRLSELARKR